MKSRKPVRRSTPLVQASSASEVGIVLTALAVVTIGLFWLAGTNVDIQGQAKAAGNSNVSTPDLPTPTPILVEDVVN